MHGDPPFSFWILTALGTSNTSHMVTNEKKYLPIRGHPSRDHKFHGSLKQNGGILRAMSYGETISRSMSSRADISESNCEAWVLFTTFFGTIFVFCGSQAFVRYVSCLPTCIWSLIILSFVKHNGGGNKSFGGIKVSEL